MRVRDGVGALFELLGVGVGRGLPSTRESGLHTSRVRDEYN